VKVEIEIKKHSVNVTQVAFLE